jgi:hypothetical protein
LTCHHPKLHCKPYNESAGKRGGRWSLYSVSFPILLPIFALLVGGVLALVRSCSAVDVSTTTSISGIAENEMNGYFCYLRRAAVAVLCVIAIVLLALLIAYVLDYVGFDLNDWIRGKVIFRIS